MSLANRVETVGFIAASTQFRVPLMLFHFSSQYHNTCDSSSLPSQASFSSAIEFTSLPWHKKGQALNMLVPNYICNYLIKTILSKCLSAFRLLFSHLSESGNLCLGIPIVLKCRGFPRFLPSPDPLPNHRHKRIHQHCFQAS